MVNRLDFGYNGLMMVQKNQKENLMKERETVFGHLGLIMGIKSSKLHMTKVSLMEVGHPGMKVE